MKCRIGVDTGGTHTDLVLIGEDGEQFLTLKVPTTPEDNSIGTMKGLETLLDRAGLSPADISRFAYGTTVVTNLLIQRDHDTSVGMLTTKGFRDIIEIRRAARGEHVYDVGWRPDLSLVPRHLRFGIPERMGFDGVAITPLDEDAVRDACREMNHAGIESVAICFLNAYANPDHERRTAEIVAQECPGLDISISSDVARQFREYERTSTTAVNAYVRRPLGRHLRSLTEKLRKRGVSATPYIMRANGGLMSFDSAAKLPVAITHSGPTAGIVAGMTIGKSCGVENLITFDMGGTSSDVSLIRDGQPMLTSKGNIEGWPVVLPMLDLITVGAGGGSVAWLDSANGLKVGPLSAGSVPGPACYGQGGENPTITDCNIILGRLNPEFFLAGARTLYPELSKKAIQEKVAGPLGLTIEEAARGILAIAESHMVNAVKQISVQRGFDPREFTLVGFGGAGPLHAIGLAEELGITSVLIPAAPGNFSAMGQLAGDIRHDLVLTRIGMLADSSPESLSAEFMRMVEEGSQRLVEEEVSQSQWQFMASFDLCYKGQNHELSVTVPSIDLTAESLKNVEQRFHAEHERNFGYSNREKPVKLVNLRVTALGRLPGLQLKTFPSGPGGAPAPFAKRTVTLPNGEGKEVPVYRFDDLKPTHVIDGPAVVEHAGSTLFIRPNWTATYDRTMTARVIHNDPAK
jgi:N-methylhydantoinase A